MTLIKQFSLFLAIALIFSSCEKIDKLTQFEMDYKQSITVPATTIIDIPFSINTPDVPTNSASIFSGYNTNRDLIDKIALNAMDMTITAPDNGDLGFLSSIRIKISAEGLPEIEIASAENIPNDIGKILRLTTSNDDLQEYIKKTSFKLNFSAELDETVPEDHVIDMAMKFFVDAKILGQ